MIRKAFVMSVNLGCEQEYERRHRPIWPELEAVLRSHGVHNYSIFLHPETRQLFGYVEIEDEARWTAVAPDRHGAGSMGKTRMTFRKTLLAATLLALWIRATLRTKEEGR